MIIKSNLLKDRIFIFAILLSLACHLFWFTAVKIIAPKKTTPVRFSKVSFLGPILTRGAIDLRVAQKTRSFLETRYLKTVNALPSPVGAKVSIPYALEQRSDRTDDPVFTRMVDEAVSGPKLEPDDAV